MTSTSLVSGIDYHIFDNLKPCHCLAREIHILLVGLLGRELLDQAIETPYHHRRAIGRLMSL